MLAFFAHAYLVVFHSFDEDNLNGRMRAYVPWFIISIFVVEGDREREAPDSKLSSKNKLISVVKKVQH